MLLSQVLLQHKHKLRKIVINIHTTGRGIATDFYEYSTSVLIARPGTDTGTGIIASLHSGIHFEGLTLEAVSAELLGFPLTYVLTDSAKCKAKCPNVAKGQSH